MLLRMKIADYIRFKRHQPTTVYLLDSFSMSLYSFFKILCSFLENVCQGGMESPSLFTYSEVVIDRERHTADFLH